MSHWKTLFDSRFLGSWDLDEIKNKEIAVTIEDVIKEDVFNVQENDKHSVPVLKFRGAKKGMALNKTNAQRLEKLYGPDIENWKGKKIILCVERIKAFGDLTDAVRVKDTKLAAATAQPKMKPKEKKPVIDDPLDEDQIPGAESPEPISEPPPVTARTENEDKIEKALVKKGAMGSDTFLGAWSLTRMNWRRSNDETVEEIAGECG